MHQAEISRTFTRINADQKRKFRLVELVASALFQFLSASICVNPRRFFFPADC
jgi:hypothetical protein